MSTSRLHGRWRKGGVPDLRDRAVSRVCPHCRARLVLDQNVAICPRCGSDFGDIAELGKPDPKKD